MSGELQRIREPSYEEVVAKLAEVSIECHKLREENEQLRAENEQLRAENQQLRAENQQLREQLDDLQVQALRQAAPFRVPEQRRKEEKKPPGRKEGHPGSCRRLPDQIDHEIVVELNCCPKCGGPVEDVRPVEQYIEEIPPVRPVVTRLVTHEGRCPRCGKVRSTHPLQVSFARGCAKVHLGPRALGIAAQLKEHLGLPFRKISSAFRELFGLSVTAGAIAQGLQRVAERLQPLYGQMCLALRSGPVVHADETSWWVGQPAWLWVFARMDLTVYVVNAGRGSDVVQRMLGDGFAGVLASDCLASYDPIDCIKQKCYAHHLRALSAAIKQVPPEHARPLHNLKLMLQLAMDLARNRDKMSPEQFADRAARYRRAVDAILDQVYTGPGVEKALHRFRKHRNHLFTFLERPEVPPDNNLAERRLRPAVIARKISCGNRTQAGKVTWQILTSIASTCGQRTESFMELVGRSMPLLAAPPHFAGDTG